MWINTRKVWFVFKTSQEPGGKKPNPNVATLGITVWVHVYCLKEVSMFNTRCKYSQSRRNVFSANLEIDSGDNVLNDVLCTVIVKFVFSYIVLLHWGGGEKD